MKLPLEFYQSVDVVSLSKLLLGKVLCSKINGIVTSGMITETEAYAGIMDKASHAYGERRTKRTSVMYMAGGLSYVYLCYSIHHLFNVVTGPENTSHAVLIRGIKPMDGKPVILQRLSKKVMLNNLTNGPGKLTRALGIMQDHNGIKLNGNAVWIEDRGIKIENDQILIGPRIGIDYAGVDAHLPYRFLIKEKATLNF